MSRFSLKNKEPGNVRELQNFIERAVILTRGKALEAPLAELQKTGKRMAVGSVSRPSGRDAGILLHSPGWR